MMSSRKYSDDSDTVTNSVTHTRPPIGKPFAVVLQRLLFLRGGLPQCCNPNRYSGSIFIYFFFARQHAALFFLFVAVCCQCPVPLCFLIRAIIYLACAQQITASAAAVGCWQGLPPLLRLCDCVWRALCRPEANCVLSWILHVVALRQRKVSRCSTYSSKPQTSTKGSIPLPEPRNPGNKKHKTFGH